MLLDGENRLSLMPLYLGSLYTRLDECSRCVARSIGQYDVVSYVDVLPSNVLVERFEALSLAVEFKSMKP